MAKQESSFDRAIRSLREENFGAFLKRTWLFFWWRIVGFVVFYPYAQFRFSAEAAKVKTPEASVDFVFDRFGRIFLPMQIPSEITALAHFVNDMKPRVVLEIGTARGGTLFIFSKLAAHDATIISIDQPIGYPQWRENLYKKFPSAEQQLHLMRLDSHKQETVQALSDLLQGRKIDFMFIDADHSYEGVKRDYELFSPFVRKGGAVAFHDVIKPSPVSVFWNELKKEKKTEEFIQDPEQGWAAIGVAFM